MHEYIVYFVFPSWCHDFQKSYNNIQIQNAHNTTKKSTHNDQLTHNKTNLVFNFTNTRLMSWKGDNNELQKR
jgi:hypothetical protein